MHVREVVVGVVEDRVVAVVAEQLINAGAAVDGVVARAAVNDVRAIFGAVRELKQPDRAANAHRIELAVGAHDEIGNASWYRSDQLRCSLCRVCGDAVDHGKAEEAAADEISEHVLTRECRGAGVNLAAGDARAEGAAVFVDRQDQGWVAGLRRTGAARIVRMRRFHNAPTVIGACWCIDGMVVDLLVEVLTNIGDVEIAVARIERESPCVA